MAAPLKHLAGPAMVLQIANRISVHMPAFNTAAFIQQFVAHYGELELMPRCQGSTMLAPAPAKRLSHCG